MKDKALIEQIVGFAQKAQSSFIGRQVHSERIYRRRTIRFTASTETYKNHP